MEELDQWKNGGHSPILPWWEESHGKNLQKVEKYKIFDCSTIWNAKS